MDFSPEIIVPRRELQDISLQGFGCKVDVQGKIGISDVLSYGDIQQSLAKLADRYGYAIISNIRKSDHDTGIRDPSRITSSPLGGQNIFHTDRTRFGLQGHFVPHVIALQLDDKGSPSNRSIEIATMATLADLIRKSRHEALEIMQKTISPERWDSLLDRMKTCTTIQDCHQLIANLFSCMSSNAHTPEIVKIFYSWYASLKKDLGKDTVTVEYEPNKIYLVSNAVAHRRNTINVFTPQYGPELKRWGFGIDQRTL